MPKKTEPDLTLEAVAALGADRLAALLVEHADRDDRLRQKLLLALAAVAPGDRLVKTLQTQINRVRASSHFYDHYESSAFAHELDTLRQAITTDLLPRHPRAAAELLEQFVHLDGNVFERADDSNGEIGHVFQEAVEDWGTAWAAVEPRDRLALAKTVFEVFRRNAYGAHDGVIAAFGDALGREGLADLERLIRIAAGRTPPSGDAEGAWRQQADRRSVLRGLQQIADVRGAMWTAFSRRIAWRAPRTPSSWRSLSGSATPEGWKKLCPGSKRPRRRIGRSMSWTT